jgi:hypothetical protein
MKWTPSGLQNSSSPSLALRAGRPPNRSANYTAVNLGFLLTVTDVWTQLTSKRRSCTNCLPRGDRAVIEVAVRPIPKRFSEVVDKLPPGSWVALTPDRKLVAGMGATKEKAAENAEAEYGLQNPNTDKSS